MRRPQSRLGTLLRRAEGFGSPRWVREGQGTPDGVKCLTNKAPRLARIEKTGYNSSQKCFCYVFVCICLKNCLAGPFDFAEGEASGRAPLLRLRRREGQYISQKAWALPLARQRTGAKRWTSALRFHGGNTRPV